jgi:hypothetical protein
MFKFKSSYNCYTSPRSQKNRCHKKHFAKSKTVNRRTSLGFKLNRTIHVRTSWTNEVPQYDGHPLTQENRITHCRHLEGNTSSTSGVSFGTVFKNCSSAGRRFSKFWPTLHIKYHLDNPTSTSTSRDCPICIQCQYVTLCRMIAIWTICYQDLLRK